MKNYSTVKRYFESELIKYPKEATVSLNMNSVKIVKSYEDKNYIGFEAVSTSLTGICKHCGQVISRFKQYKTTYTTVAKFNNKNIILKWKKKMYKCPDCSASSTENLLGCSGRNQKSDSFIESMLEYLKETMSFSAVARLHKVSVSNVIQHFDKASFVETDVDRTKVKNISVDEVRFVRQKYANYQFVIMDSDTQKVLDVIRTRQQEVIRDHLAKHYSGIQTFTQDLWRPYKNVAYALFPKTKVIADRFHVVRQFMWAFSRTRIALAKEQKKASNKNWKLLTKAKKALSEKGKQKWDLLLAKDPRLNLAHQVKEMALELFRCKDRESYSALLPAFKELIYTNHLVEFQKAYSSIENWHCEILNMFDYPYSNGTMERINRSIKQSKNIAFGFTNLIRATKLIQYRIN